MYIGACRIPDSHHTIHSLFRELPGDRARTQHDCLRDVIAELFFIIRQTVEHLSSSLTVANVDYLVDLSLFLDLFDVGRNIVNTHLRVRVVPVVAVDRSFQGLVFARVPCAAIVTDPNVIACIN